MTFKVSPHFVHSPLNRSIHLFVVLIVELSHCANIHVLRLVLETLNPLSEDRKCFRMINGVLVERTVKDVIPALRTNSEGLKQVLDDLVVQYKSKQDEMEKWKVSLLVELLDIEQVEISDHVNRKRIM